MMRTWRMMLVSAVVVLALIAGTVGGSAAEEPGGGSDGDAGDLDPAAVGDGTYEACDPSFGLGKPTIVALEFIVDGAPAAPPLTYPADVTVVVDYPTAAGGTATCRPQVVTQELWDTSLWVGGSVGLPLPPGNLVLLPADPEAERCPDPGPSTVRVVGAPSSLEVTTATASVPWPWGVTCSGDSETALAALLGPVLTTPQIQALIDLDTGPWPVDGCEEDGTGSPVDDLAAAGTALVGALQPAFLVVYEENAEGAPGCVAVIAAVEVYAIQWSYEASTDNVAQFALVTAPTPEPVVTFTG
jgi:hypothetical protein